MTLTSSSRTAAVTAASNSSGIGGTIVFSRSGRLSVIVATRSATPYSSVSYMGPQPMARHPPPRHQMRPLTLGARMTQAPPPPAVNAIRRLPFSPVGVAAEGLEVVVESAEPGQIRKFRDAGAAVAVAVIPFQPPAGIAAGNDELGVPHVEGGAQVSRDGVAGVGHGHDVDALGDKHLQDGVLAHVPGDTGRDRAHARNLTGFAFDRVAADERLVVDDDVDHRVGPHIGRTV